MADTELEAMVHVNSANQGKPGDAGTEIAALPSASTGTRRHSGAGFRGIEERLQKFNPITAV
ncbi:MAG: hypothetical protein KDJ90_07290 [Nitratireductor sp.]|nr:hypothetical protein [Nitratireductor sp.]